MKKSTFIILALMLIAAMLIGCTQGQDELQDGVHPETVKAVIEAVGENSILVQPLEGLDDIDIIYFNIGDDTLINVSDDAPLEPGTVVYAKIGNAIMESYPPQVHLIEILKTEIDDSIILVPIMDSPADPQNTDNTALAPDDYVTAKVTAIDGDIYTIEVLNANLYSGEMTITIPQHVLNADMPITLGYLIGVYITADGDTYTAEKLVFSEPDEIIELDDRERVSGYLDGMFPSAVYDLSDEQITTEAGVPFAIGLVQPNDTVWTLMPQDNITLIADGTDADAGDLPDDMGSDVMATHYFGISADTAGEYTLTFTRPDVNGGEDVVHNVMLTVE